MAKVLLLAYRDGLSDERAMEAVRFDLRWKIALDLRPSGFSPYEPGPVPRAAAAAWQGAVGVRALA
ncbi:MAG: transposase [Gammaproteobacteria bacterium]|nr:transposase [Gammaproteobacteria bacterium]